ncbi:MAG: polymer-forming cytoskeletal protein [Acidobacteria bacterium]|nr:polymer-forming cytoskeletal protein [Acidobacteriota bacterium]
MSEDSSLFLPDNTPSLSRIPPDAKLKGDLNVTGAIQVDGRLEGNLVSGGPVRVTGTVIGDIRSPSVVSSGTVKGNIRSSGYVKLMKGSFAKGDIHAPSVIVQEGASHNGRIQLLTAAPDKL